MDSAKSMSIDKIVFNVQEFRVLCDKFLAFREPIFIEFINVASSDLRGVKRTAIHPTIMSHLSAPGSTEWPFDSNSMPAIVHHLYTHTHTLAHSRTHHILETNTTHIAGHFLILFIFTKGNARFSTFDKWGLCFMNFCGKQTSEERE